MGGIFDVRWVHSGIITVGPYCTAQGIIQRIGELGVPLITLVCTFPYHIGSSETNVQLTRFSLSIHLWWLCGVWEVNRATSLLA